MPPFSRNCFDLLDFSLLFSLFFCFTIVISNTRGGGDLLSKCRLLQTKQKEKQIEASKVDVDEKKDFLFTIVVAV